MPYKDKEKQRQAQWEYTRKYDKYPIMIFNQIKGRIKHKASYKGRLLGFDKDAFVAWMTGNADYQRLYPIWKAANYKLSLAPSVDRINNNGDYTFDNIRIITQSENSIKMHREGIAIVPNNSKHVTAISNVGTVQSFKSIVEAAVVLGLKEKGIRAILNKMGRSLHGYSFFTIDGDLKV